MATTLTMTGLAVIIGLALLVWSADLFVEGATRLATRFQVPSFLIGVLILGVGTSAPEMVVSALSAWEGSPGLALGNAYGSNIINISLVLGVTALISPILIRGEVVYKDLLLLLIATGLAAWQLSDGQLTRMEGVVLMIMLIVILGVQVYFSSQQSTDVTDKFDGSVNTPRALVILIVGMTILIISSRLVVWGAVELATLWGMSELLIGLTIVAVGTSLPELVSSVAAANKGKQDMALGNIVGSNLFNTLGVVGLAAIIHPLTVAPNVITRDMVMVVITTVLLFGLAWLSHQRRSSLKRGSGTVLVLTFVGYTVWLGYSTVVL